MVRSVMTRFGRKMVQMFICVGKHVAAVFAVMTSRAANLALI